MTQKRILQLSDKQTEGDCVVYVMSRDQRVSDNHALLAAQELAIDNKLPLIVLFHLKENVGVRAQEHYLFMVTGLKKVEADLSSLGIRFILVIGETANEPLRTLNSLKPIAVFFDFSPLKGVRLHQKAHAAELKCSSFIVDTHNIIPLWEASEKLEFAAHTMRGKIHKKLGAWLVEPPALLHHPFSSNAAYDLPDWEKALKLIKTIPANNNILTYLSGEDAARRVLELFIHDSLPTYALERNNPLLHATSGLSPYLHFGQISSLRVAIELLAATGQTPLLLQEAKLAQAGNSPSAADGMNAVLEELIVRKELADNYCFYSEDYTSMDGAWSWAKETLETHGDDPREHIYTLEEFDQAATHDQAWNAAQNEMRLTGKMHGYMRMYWAKKILEWSPDANTAIKTAIYLNDHYSIDGGDPNGYTGIMWSIAGVHDRPWFDRPIFGKIRFMNEAGLSRKFDFQLYIQKWND